MTRLRLAGNPQGLLESLNAPVLIDEWQLQTPVRDAVRRSVDAAWVPGRYLLTGSANPHKGRAHTGAGRFVNLRMRPLAFSERDLETPSVSLSGLIDGSDDVQGTTSLCLEDYVHEIIGSGFPDIRAAGDRIRPRLLTTYIDTALRQELPQLGLVLRRQHSLAQWLRAYAAATSTTASFEAIAAAVDPDARPARSTIIDYRDALSQLWLLDEVPAWVPTGPRPGKIGQAPKHQLADPGLAASLLGVNAEGLLRSEQGGVAGLRRGPLIGTLFESLVTLSLRTLAQPLGFEVTHLRTHRGEHEVDLILQAPDGRVVAVEVKLNPIVNDTEVRHLHWLREYLGDDLVASFVVTTGQHAYRRADGVAVIPLSLLGP